MNVEIKDTRLRHIIASAADVFYEKGFARTSISDICKSANCSRTTLYSHFENKENVYLAVINNSFENFLHYFTNLNVDSTTGLNQMLDYAQGYIEYAKQYPKNYEMILYFYSLLKSVNNKALISDVDIALSQCAFFPQVKKNAEIPATFLVKVIRNGQKDSSISNKQSADTLFLNVWAYLIGCSNLFNLAMTRNTQMLGLKIKSLDKNILNIVERILT